MTVSNGKRAELDALLEEFVLYTDDTPHSSEPTELSVYLRQCGFDGAMSRLAKELWAWHEQEIAEAKLKAGLFEYELIEDSEEWKYWEGRRKDFIRVRVTLLKRKLEALRTKAQEK